MRNYRLIIISKKLYTFVDNFPAFRPCYTVNQMRNVMKYKYGLGDFMLKRQTQMQFSKFDELYDLIILKNNDNISCLKYYHY